MALTDQDQQDLMWDIVGTFNISPGRTLYAALTDLVLDGASRADVVAFLVAHPLFSDNTIGEYPNFQTSEDFADEWMGRTLGERGVLVENDLWDGINALIVGWDTDPSISRADIITLITQYLQLYITNPELDLVPGLEDAAQWLANKVEVALYQAIDLELDIPGETLEDFRSPFEGVDTSEASVTAAKAALDEILNPTLPTVTASVESNGVEGSTDVVIKLMLDEAQDEDVVVSIASGDGSDTATPGADYAAIAEQVTFAAGETVKFVTLPVVDDDDYEAEETVTLNVSSSDATVANASVTATITSDDAFAILKPASEGNDIIDTTQEDPQTILGSNANLNAGDVITGGPEDTLILSLDGALPGEDDYNFAGFTIDGVGTVQVTNDSGQTVSLDMSNSDDVMTLVSQNSTADLEFNFVNTNDGDVNLKVLNLTDGVNVTLDVRNDDAAATDNEVNLQVTDSDDDGEDADTITIDEDMEIVNLSTMDSSGEVSITTLVTDGAHTLNIDTEVDLTIDDPLSSSVDSVYAGSATGDIDLSTEDNDTGALIVSGSGDDLFTTGDGGDTVYGGAGDDSIYAGSGANLVYGEDGMDTINALGGNDTLWGGADDDEINAGDGNNQAWGGTGDDDITVGTGNDIVVAAEGDDYIDITAGGEDNVSGGDDDDVVDAGSSLTSSFTETLNDDDNGGDTLDGGDGDDVLNIDSSNPDGNFLDRVTNFETINIDGEDNLTVTITDSSDFDHDTTETVIDASGMTGDLTFEGNDLAPNNPFPDDESVSPFTGIDDDVLSRSITIIGGSGDDRIVTGLGEDEITGNTGNDSIYTGAGNDTVNGAVGDDSIYMEAGDDLLIVQNNELDGDDYEISGGTGDDTIQLVVPSSDGQDSIYAELDSAVSGIQTLQVVDNDPFNDDIAWIWVDSSYDNLEPGGSATRSVLTIDATELDASTEALHLYTYDLDSDGDEIDEDFNILGSAGADQFWMGNNLDSGDTIVGGTGNDIVASTGSGTGSDASFANVSDVEIYLYDDAHTATLGANAQAAGIMTVEGSGGDDTLIATAFTSGLTVNGNGGEDDLSTGSGNDTIDGGDGDDTIDAGGGNDTVINSDEGNDEDITLGMGNDNLIVTGTALGAGDMVDGGAGDDTITLDNTDNAPVTANIDLDNITSIENYAFMDADREPTDTPYNFTINFIGGNVLTLTTIEVDASNLTDDDGDAVTVDISAVADKDYQFFIDGGSGNDTVIGNTALPENLDFDGNAGNDTLVIDGGDLGTTVTTDGGSGDDTLQISSGSVTDDSFVDVTSYEILTATAGLGLVQAQLGEAAEATGISTIVGGSGDDWVELDPAFDPASLTVDLSAGGEDSIYAGNSTTTVTFQADASDIDGNDVLEGGSGTGDSIELTADNGTADLTGMSNVAQVNVVEDGDASIGIMIDDNTFTGTGGTITVDGTALNDTTVGAGIEDLPEGGMSLMAGGVGEDNDLVVHGGNGDDSIYTGAGDDFIDVNLGDDFVDSGAGNDEIVNNGGNNTVIAGSGEDTVTLGDGDNYVDAGSGDDEVTTGSGSDVVMGGDGNDVLSTGSGNDWVSGGAGDDQITVAPGTVDSVDQQTTVTGGAGTDEIDIQGTGGVTLRIENVSDSVGLARDVVTGFAADDAITVENQATAAGVNSANFAGNAADFSDAQGAISLTANDNVADYVYQQDTDKLWIDVNDDGVLNGLDVQITLSGTAAIANFQVSIVDTIAPVFQAPSVNVTNLDENSGAGQTVYDANATDYSGVTFSLDGTDAGAFSIDPNTGVVTLTGDPNFEGQSSYSYSVIATDGAVPSNSSQVDLTLTVNNLDEQSPNITSSSTPSVDENVGAGTIVHTVVADDSADISAGVTYSITGGADAGQFTINATTGELTLLANPDFEGQASYTVDVAADDGVTAPDTQTITLSVNDKDETAPVIAALASPYSVDENTDASTVIIDVDATDPASDSGDGPSNPVTFSLSGVDAGFLTIDADDGEVRFNVSPDHESKVQYNFNVVATDAAGNAAVEAVVVDIVDLDEVAPTITSGAAAPDISENSGAGQVIYTVTATDNDEADVVVAPLAGLTAAPFSLGTLGGDEGAFSIDATTGEVTLTNNPDFEDQSSYSFEVQAVDNAGNVASQIVTLDIDDVAGLISYTLLDVTSSSFTIFASDEAGAGNLSLTAPVDGADDVNNFPVNDGETTFSVSTAITETATAIVVENGEGTNTGVQVLLYQGTGTANTADGTGVTTPSIMYGFGGDDSLTGTDAADTIYGGAGADVANGGAGADVYGFGAGDLVATAGVLADADTDAGSSTTEQLTNASAFDVITFAAGDTIDLSELGLTNAVVDASAGAGVDDGIAAPAVDEVVWQSGTYAAGAFTHDAVGGDALLAINDGGAVSYIVVVGGGTMTGAEIVL